MTLRATTERQRRQVPRLTTCYRAENGEIARAIKPSGTLSITAGNGISGRQGWSGDNLFPIKPRPGLGGRPAGRNYEPPRGVIPI